MTGLTIILEDENGIALSSLDHKVDAVIFLNPTEITEFKLIKYIDLYGDTVFNNLQMDDLIADLNRLKESNPSYEIDPIVQLAVRCKSERHLYLKFNGD